MKKTLGGDRLGTGAKMEVELHGFGRSTHNLSKLWRSTMAAGTIVPFLSEIALPDDTWDIEVRANLNTHPTLGPLFGSMKLQVDIFIAPIKLYVSRLMYNELDAGLKMADIKLPQIQLTSNDVDESTVTDIDNSQINPSCILSYLGIRGVGRTPGNSRARLFNAIPLIMYWDCYKNYYANKQEKIGAAIHTPAVANNETVQIIQILNSAGSSNVPFFPTVDNLAITKLNQLLITYTGTAPIGVMINTVEKGAIPFEDICGTINDDGAGSLLGQYNWARWGDLTITSYRYRAEGDGSLTPKVTTFLLSNLDKMRRDILKQDDAVFVIDAATQAPYRWVVEKPNGIANSLSVMEGLGLKTYQSDLFNNWLETESIDGAGGINAISAIDTSGGSFEIPQLIIARKVYDMLNRVAVSGGSVEDWIAANWSEKRYRECTTPMYMGGMIQEITFQEVISNSVTESDTGTQPLGTLAGTGRLGGKKKGGNITIKVEDPSWVLGLVSITPRTDYSQGNKWNVHLKTMDDPHKPMLDEIGFQDLITEQMAWWDTSFDDINNVWIQKSAGKQPAWVNYMTNVNEVLGNFAIKDNEMFMTLNRRYELEAGTIKDLTTYIDPAKFNFIFAETAIDAQNFWVQIAVDATVRRKMSAKLMPML